jgi:glycosyltransferase EpsE
MKFEKRKISVIMGIYNCQDTLEEAMNSLIKQTFTDWNIIMCDDGSKDNTVLIAEKIAEKLPGRVLLLKNEQNMGLNYTLNRCLENVNGEYTARMDADDISLPTRFEKEVRFLEEHPEYDFVSAPMILFDENGEWGCDWGKEKPEAIDLMISRPFCHAACMIRTEAFIDVKGYTVDKKLLRVEDLHLWMKLYAQNHYGYNIQEPLYMMRDDRNAYSRRKFKYRINESYIKILTIKTFHFSWFYSVYALRPILVGLLPNWLYDKLHKWSLKQENN